MRAIEEFHVPNAFAFENTIGAACVRDGFTGEFVAYPIRDARRRDAQPIIAGASCRDSRAANAISVLEGLKHYRQIFRIILQIGIEGSDKSTTRDLHSGPARR